MRKNRTQRHKDILRIRSGLPLVAKTHVYIFLLVGLYSLLSTLAGCGYTTRSLISNRFKTIYVAQFENKIDITQEADASARYKIYRPALETDITRAVIDRFTLDGNLRIAKEEEADLILKGALIDYRRDALRYTSEENVEEYRISIKVDLLLLDKNKDTVWEQKGLTGDTTYFISGSNAKTDAAAVEEALKDLARRIVERAVEDW